MRKALVRINACASLTAAQQFALLRMARLAVTKGGDPSEGEESSDAGRPWQQARQRQRLLTQQEDAERDEVEVALRSYARTEKALDEIERDAAAMFFRAFVHTRDSLVALVRRDYDPERTTSNWVAWLQLKGWNEVQQAFAEMLRASFMLGTRNTRAWVHRFSSTASTYAVRRAPRRVVSKEGLQYFENKKLYLSGVLKEELVKKAQGIMLEAMRRGQGVERTVAQLQELFEPLVGKDWSIADWDIVKPSRLRTIVRTNTTDAYNAGVLHEYRSDDLEPLIKAVRYTAVLDDRTTYFCDGMDRTLFKPDDPRLDELTPPNHYNCRSILEPVTFDERKLGGRYLTKEKYTWAIENRPGFK